MNSKTNNMRLFFSILIFAFTISSCRKDQCGKVIFQTTSYDTIIPHPYFPAYPGSWWEYNDSSRIETYADWQRFNYVQYKKGNCEAFVKDSVFVPVVVDEKPQFLHYDRYISQKEYCFNDQSAEILFNSASNQWPSWTNPKNCFSGYGENGDPRRTRQIINVLDSFSVNGITYNDILVIQEQSLQYIYVTFTTTYYYAKNIGIIREIHDPANPADTINDDTLDLISYYIAN